MLEIGVTFPFIWYSDEGEEYNEEVTVHGYVFYEGYLYYTCVGPSGVYVEVVSRRVGN